MKDVIAKSKGFAVATATKDGEPNVVPMGAGRVLSDDEILLVKNLPGKTLDNMRANPKVAISVWDMGTVRGYQFKGNARIETSGSLFDESVKWIKSLMPKAQPIAVVVVKVSAIYQCTPEPNAGKQVG